MSIEVRSPHNGEMVKVMEKDVGRAVKDSDGRIFYVLPKADGAGFYAARTRAGAETDEARAVREDTRMGAHQKDAKQRDAARPTARKSKLPIMIGLVVVILVVAYLFILGPLKGMLGE